jgi:hypothetical protein
VFLLDGMRGPFPKEKLSPLFPVKKPCPNNRMLNALKLCPRYS